MSRLAALLLFALIPALPAWAQNPAPAVKVKVAKIGAMAPDATGGGTMPAMGGMPK